jgi:hypothetical protein
MPVFKTTDEILKNRWEVGQETAELPCRHEWIKAREVNFLDITIWEQIYFQPGNIGIYAAWSPYVEMYVITYNLLDRYKVYFGENAGKTVFETAQTLGIILPINQVWVPTNDPLLKESRLTPLE